MAAAAISIQTEEGKEEVVVMDEKKTLALPVRLIFGSNCKANQDSTLKKL